MRHGTAVLAAILTALAAHLPAAGEPQSARIAGPATAPASRPQPPRTLILGAFAEEIRILRLAVESPRQEEALGLTFTTGRLHGRDVIVGLSGVGKVNAAMTCTAAIMHFRPTEVIFTGVSGGINPELRPGDIVLGARVAHHDYGDVSDDGMKIGPTRNVFTGKRNDVFFPADARLLALAQQAVADARFEPIGFGDDQRQPRVRTGTIVTGDTFISSEAKRRQLREDLQADATEMEGAAVAQVCCETGVPHLVIRSISDSANARAVEDLRKFHSIAARNSARLVEAMAARLAAGAPATQPAAGAGR